MSTDLPTVDEAVEELGEEDETEQARLKSRWAALAQLVGTTPNRRGAAFRESGAQLCSTFR